MAGIEEDGWVVYRASLGRVLFFTLIGFAMIPAGLYCLELHYLKAKFAGYIFLCLSPLAILKCLQLLISGLLLFKYNADKICVNGMLGARSLRWSDIASVGIMEYSQHAFFGLIKTHSSKSIYLKPISGWKLYVPTQWAGFSEADMLRLGGLFHSLHARSQAASFSAAPDDYGKNDYADAVVARYLARKAEENTAPHPSSSFGQAPAPQGNAAVAFGKRRSFP